jgi:hypothetical protein
MSDTLPAGYDGWRTYTPDQFATDTSELCEYYYDVYVADFDADVDGEMLTYEEWCEEYEDKVEEWHEEELAEARADSILDDRASGYW